MRNLTGSQWSVIRTGVIWSLFRVPVRSLAAEFWTSWSLERDEVEMPEYRELDRLINYPQMSSFLMYSQSVITTCLILTTLTFN